MRGYSSGGGGAYPKWSRKLQQGRSAAGAVVGVAKTEQVSGAGLLPPTALLPHTTLPHRLGSDEYAHDFAVDWPQQAYQSGGGEFLQLEIRRQTDAQADHRPRAERDHNF